MKPLSNAFAYKNTWFRLAALVTALAMVASLAGCSNAASSDASGNNSSQAQETQEQQGEQEEQPSVVYEAIFLNNDEVQNLFVQARGETAPYANMATDFHVTTAFLPETAHSDWYGQTVTVHITTYACGEAKTDDGNITANEGLKAEVASNNEELNEYLSSLNKNFHITGSFKDAAKYTNYIDFTQGQPFEATLTGTFGAYLSSGAEQLSA